MTDVKKIPYFTTWTEVDVSISPDELEEAGWRYVGEGEGQLTNQEVLDIVQRWHARAHDVPWIWCSHELCCEVRLA